MTRAGNEDPNSWALSGQLQCCVEILRGTSPISCQKYHDHPDSTNDSELYQRLAASLWAGRTTHRMVSLTTDH
jgi:hypothetical protein